MGCVCVCELASTGESKASHLPMYQSSGKSFPIHIIARNVGLETHVMFALQLQCCKNLLESYSHGTQFNPVQGWHIGATRPLPSPAGQCCNRMRWHYGNHWGQ